MYPVRVKFIKVVFEDYFFLSGSLRLIPANVTSVRMWKILSPVFAKITLIAPAAKGAVVKIA